MRREINQRRYLVNFYKHSSDPIGDHVLERERNHDGFFCRQEAETSIFIIPDPAPFCDTPICGCRSVLGYSGLLLTLRIHIIYIYSAHQQHLLTLLIISRSEPHRIRPSAHAYSLSMYPVHRKHRNWHFILNWTSKAAYRFHGCLSVALKRLSLKTPFSEGEATDVQNLF